MKIYIEMRGDFDTLALWHMIEKYDVNLTTLGDITWVYGKVTLNTIGPLLARCAIFSDLQISLYNPS